MRLNLAWFPLNEAVCFSFPEILIRDRLPFVLGVLRLRNTWPVTQVLDAGLVILWGDVCICERSVRESLDESQHG